MNKTITTYEELLREKERLELQLEVHKAAVKMHVEDIKKKLNPVRNVLHFFSNFSAPAATDTLIGTGLGLSVEMIIRKIFFSRTGWITKMLAPILIKNFSANMLMKNKKSLVKKVKSFLHMNGKHA
jgi:hypothetical protein